MTRNEHLEFCKKCLNRKFDSKQGIICNVTNEIADFEASCISFKLDETVPVPIAENVETANEEVIISLDEHSIKKLKVHQDFYYALIGGLLATLISAVIWATITVATKYQIGYMAIGVGLLVGFAVQFFGAGIDKKFGYLGAALSLLGCLLGNLLSQVGFIAQEQSFGYFETLTYLNFNLIISILVESFNPMDILFYGIAVYEGYKFAFRKITNEVLANLKLNGGKADFSYYKLRLPLVIGSILVLAFVFFELKQGVCGPKTYKYESGKKMSEGELIKSKENGKWTYYYENGITQSVGYFSSGLPDSLWQWYDETGKIKKIGNYKKGLEHGIWINYYNNGIVSDSGRYIESRMHGFWIYKYENGKTLQTGFFKRNIQDSIFITYFENGQLRSTGKMKEGKPVGDWTTYFNNGQLSEEITYKNDTVITKNVWDINGKQLVVNGNGSYQSFSPNGQVLLSGEIKNGLKLGKWTTFFENGKRKEEGNFKNENYEMLNAWDLNEKQTVKDGFGVYRSYYPNATSVFETGEIKNGLKNGIWKTFYESNGNTFQELQYANGLLTGIQKYYFESGKLYIQGEMIEDLREGEWNWYYENGTISSSVKFSKDKKEGKQLMWSESGEKTKAEFYRSGELVEEKALKN